MKISKTFIFVLLLLLISSFCKKSKRFLKNKKSKNKNLNIFKTLEQQDKTKEKRYMPLQNKNTYQKDSLKSIAQLYIMKQEDELFKINSFRNDSDIIIGLNKDDNDYIRVVGHFGVISFVTNYTDTENIFNASDIEELSSFDNSIVDYLGNEYGVTCRLWKPLNDKLRLFCQLQKDLKLDDDYLELNNATFKYKEYNITLISETGAINVEQITNHKLPFLYSDKQEIYVEEGIDSYDLKFNIDSNSYNNEVIELYGTDWNEILIDNCTINEAELICSITKEKIEEILGYSEEEFYIGIYSDYYGGYQSESVLAIKFNYTYGIKEDIYVEITKLKENIGEIDHFIAYETNVSNISNLISAPLDIDFDTSVPCLCYLKKSESTNLLLLCTFEGEGNFSLIQKEYEEEFNNINIKYNFKIQPVTNKEIITIYGEKGSYIFNNYPITLDFTKQDSIIINILGHFEENTMDIRLNPLGNKLICDELSNMLKCTVRVNHFDYEENGYYNTHYTNYFGDIVTYYEANPFNVILPQRNIINITIEEEDNNNTILIGQKGILYFITNYDDEMNIFNISDIEAKTLFKTTITDEEGNNYNVKCRLWKPLKEKIIVICNLDSNLKEGEHKIELNRGRFTYDDYYINIYSKTTIKVNQIDYDIPFIYSDKQIINIENDKDIYEFKFNFDSYNNDILYIKGKYNNYMVLDNCETNNKELICSLSKEKLEEILILNNDNFILGTINDNIGLIVFVLVHDININYEINEKEDIYISITNLLQNTTEEGTPIAYETNLTSIPNINSDFFTLQFNETDQYCYFKKSNININLMLLCLINSTRETFLGEITEEIILNHIHYKYNFRIQPCENYDSIYIDMYGTQVRLTYPEELNFQSEDTIIIRYIMDSPNYANKIKLNPESSDLECEDLNEMKKCIVPITHFDNKESGYYYTFHSNHLNDSSIYYESNSINVILPSLDKRIEIQIEDKYNHNIYIGINGTLYFISSYNDTDNIFNISDIEENTIFETIITDEDNNKYNVICRLWKPENDNIRIFCDLNYTLPKEQQHINFDLASFEYNGYDIIIKYNASYLNVIQYNTSIPFLYSGQQIINIEEEKESYEIKFKIGKYNNELLFIFGRTIDMIILDQCNIQGKDLICNLKKESIEKNLAFNNFEFIVYTYNDILGLLELRVIPEILINYYEYVKEDIYIKITKLLQNTYEINNFITYETNVTTISNFNSILFTIELQKEYMCFMKKTEGKNLLIICRAEKEGTYSLGEIKEEIRIEYLNIKYNFIIVPVINDEEYIVQGDGTYIIFNKPKLLDFNLKENMTIEFYTPNPELFNNIKLNPDSDDLECENGVYIKKCIVPKSHFERKSSGYYYTYHLNKLNNYSISYELSPIEIILPKENEVILNIKKEDNNYERLVGKNGVIDFITSYNDSKYNIFNSSDIEEKTIFEATLTDQLNNIYNVNCYLWEPTNEKIRIFCKLYDDLKEGDNKLYIKKATFEYKEYNITIISDDEPIRVYYFNNTIPFLYSEKQEINVEDGIDTYNLIFKIGLYNNELLKLYYKDSREMLLDDCQISGNEVICQMTKEKIEEILVFNGQEFGIEFIVNDLGYFRFDQVSNIKFNYPNVTKENIYVNITKLKDNIGEKEHYIAYETNIDVMNKINSGSFNLKFNGTNEYSCLFKKHDIGNLLLLCNIYEVGTFTLEPTESDILLDKINIKYNFIIQPISNDESFIITDTSGIIFRSNYPQILDYTKQDPIEMILVTPIPRPNKEIKLNPYSENNLEYDTLNGILRFIIPMSHFDYVESGYYNTYFKNSFNKLSIFYELPPFNVILPKRNLLKLLIREEENNNTLNIGEKGTIYFTTNYNDNETNIFDPSDIEELTSFKTTISDEYDNNYNINCRLWKPTDGKIILICNLDENLKYITQKIILNKSNLNYKDYNISIISETNIEINQYNYDIPFIYSDEQFINIEEDKNEYELKFKFESYNNDILFLSSDNSKSTLDICEVNEKELLCKISKEKIEEILTYQTNYKINNKGFILGTLNDNYGVLYFNLVGNIYIDYNITEKEDIYVYINKLIENVSEAKTLIAYATNITTISNLNTDKFLLLFNNSEIYCSFKKYDYNNLLLLCEINNENEIYLGEITEEIKINNIHYKYNFRIQPVENYEIISYDENYSGTSIELVYPDILNFTAEEDITIRYIMKNPLYAKNIKLNIDSYDLECEDLNEMKKCIISINHFTDKESGYYYTYHLNHLNGSSIYYESNPINVILPPLDKRIEIKIEDEYNKEIKVGINGILYFVSSYNDTDNIFNISNIEENTIFETTLTDEDNNKYNIICRLWKPINDNIRIFCDLNNTLPKEKQYINFDSADFNYDGYKIIINSYVTSLYVEQFDIEIPFLYSDKQIIDVEEDKENYELKFKIGKYNNEILIFSGETMAYEIFDRCKIDRNDLICEIKKEKIEEIMTHPYDEFELYYQNKLHGLYILNMVSKIILHYNDVIKENIPVSIIKLLENNNEINSFIYYETNISSISNVYTDYFYLNFEKDNNFSCYFKKEEGMNLLLLCLITDEGTYSLAEIKEEIVLDDINIKYNFIIQPVINDEEFTTKENGTNFRFIYPQILDFTINDNIIIDYFGISPELSNKIKFNTESSELKCENGENIKRCIVPKSHFERKSSGYYYTYHLNSVNNYSIYYEVSRVKVILPIENEFIIRINQEDNNYERIVGQKGIISFITNYNDNEYNIFNTSDIEEKTEFETTLTDQLNNKYDVTCRLWKPLSDKIRIFCKLQENLNSNTEYIKNMTKATFEYNEYNITIISEAGFIKINNVNGIVPFLYSDKQEINIEKGIDSYNLIFNIDSYNNELLELYGGEFKIVIFDNCLINEKELICSITKEKIEEILVKDGESYNLAFINDNFGAFKFDSISEIKFNYKNVEKEDIYIDIIKLKENISDMYTYITYETNVTSINSVITNYFRLEFNDLGETMCLFKKSDSNNLLLLCYMIFDGTFSLKQSESEKVLNDINIKYNFRIQPISNNETFIINDEFGTYYSFGHPEILDFTNKSSLVIRFMSSDEEAIEKIKLNPNEDDLECENNNGIVKCNVPISHFNNGKSGYYNLYYLNSQGSLSIHYEVNPFKVILPARDNIIMVIKEEDNKEILNIGKKGTLYFITNYTDNELNIFDPSDIEEKTTFETTISDDEKKN